MEEICSMTSKFSELCFSKEAFTTDNFSVDQFVSEYRKHTSLETLKEDLSLFLKVLQSAMVELINKDYADFVNLSTNLVGLDKSIKNLSTPFMQVKSEISAVETRLDGTLEVLQGLLEKRGEIHKKKNTLYRVMMVLEGIENTMKHDLQPPTEAAVPLEIIERISMEFNQIMFHMNQCLNMKVISDKQDMSSNLSNTILQHLEFTFLKSIEDRDSQTLYVVLRVYSAIDKTKEIESKFRKHVVKPYMREIIQENVINREGLEKMFQLVLDFIPLKCCMILDITRGGREDIETLKGYDFLVNSVWPEIVLCLDYLANMIFAPGNPILFHKNYIVSMIFLEKFERACGVQTSVKKLRGHPSYKSFMEKWNLPLYFEIRFQEIGGVLETALSLALERSVDETYCLKITSALWQCVQLCWDRNIYLSPLGHRFWKLTLQLFSRYCIWVFNLLNQEESSNSSTLPIEETKKTNDASLSTLVMLVHDIDLIMSQVSIFFKKSISVNFPQITVQQILTDAVKQCVTEFENLSLKAGKILVDRSVTLSSANLKLLTEIPRMYRKTNRDVPSKPSTYVSLVFSPLEKFISETEMLVDSLKIQSWLVSIIKLVTEQCFNMTTDVITSVRKMEDSLKRLKKGRASNQPITKGTMSDDDKIRHQLLIDVQHFGHLIEIHGVSKEDVNFNKLEELVRLSVSPNN